MEDKGLKKVLQSKQGYEDYIEYFIFLPRSLFGTPEEAVAELQAAIQFLTKNYIWQKDNINVKEVTLNVADECEDDVRSAELMCFHGVTRYGENVEDEWFATWVMAEISKKFAGCVVRVIDNDGEFLLIEAADHLPDWAESDQVCQKRVYLYKGKVHLIPKIDNPSRNIHTFKTPRVSEAVELIQENPDLTVASDKIQRAIQSRLTKFPLKEQDYMHVNVIVPYKVAEMLNIHPELVAPAVEAFYYREPVELTAARLMKNLKPNEGIVKTRIRLTKFLYAMLSKQDFRPDGKTGWTFPRPTAAEFKGHSLGAKLTTGFEILLSRSKPTDSAICDVENTSGYLLYLEKLEKYGYFQDFLKGSKPFQELESKAKNYYMENVALDSETSSSVEQKLRRIFESVRVDPEGLKRAAVGLPPDDDDSWINITPENLESVLQNKFETNLQERPEDIPLKLKEFMSKMAEFEGVDLPMSPHPNEDRSEHSVGSDGALDPLDFRADDFVSAMDKLLTDLGKPDKDWDESDDSYSEDDEMMEEIMKKHTFAKDSKFHQLMSQMDSELAGTDVAKTCKEGDDDEFDDIETFEPVDIDTAALQNMLKSFQSQEFPTSGPSSNLLRSVCFDISKAAGASSSSSSKK